MEKKYYYDDDFKYGTPEQNQEYKTAYKPNIKGITQYQEVGRRVPNKGIDTRTGAPAYINKSQINYDKNDEHYLQKKYDLDDDGKENYKESSTWFNTQEKTRKFSNRLKHAIENSQMFFSEQFSVNSNYIYEVFSFANYYLQKVKNAICIKLGVHPEMMENFLSLGMEHGKVSAPVCFITSTGESDENLLGFYKTGPSLLKLGFPKMSNEELSELVDLSLIIDEQYDELLDIEQSKIRRCVKYIKDSIKNFDNDGALTFKNVLTELRSLYYDFEKDKMQLVLKRPKDVAYQKTMED